jgi:hypothetical protein
MTSNNCAAHGSAQERYAGPLCGWNEADRAIAGRESPPSLPHYCGWDAISAREADHVEPVFAQGSAADGGDRNPLLAGFLTRLCPRAWQARYGAEYRVFLETRRVSLIEMLDVIRQAAVENVSENWRCTPILLALLFSVAGGSCLAGGHAREIIAQYPALAAAWFAMEAGALAALLYALSLSIAITRSLEIALKHVPWILLAVAAVWRVAISSMAMDFRMVGSSDWRRCFMSSRLQKRLSMTMTQELRRISGSFRPFGFILGDD